MFKPSHFASRHFSASHFVGRAAVITVVTTDGVIRQGIATGPKFVDIVDTLIKEDEEILLMIVSFIEVTN